MANEAGSEVAEIRAQMNRLLSEVQNLQSRVEAIEAAGGIKQTERPDTEFLSAMMRVS
jgi:prefoldin subunit 5